MNTMKSCVLIPTWKSAACKVTTMEGEGEKIKLRKLAVNNATSIWKMTNCSQGTYQECDLPAPHPVDLEADLFDLVTRQLYAAANLIISHMNSSSTAHFWIVTGARIELCVSIVPHLPNQL